MKIIKYETLEGETLVKRSIKCKDSLFDSNLAAILRFAHEGKYTVEEEEEEEQEATVNERLEKLESLFGDRLEKLETALNKILKFIGKEV